MATKDTKSLASALLGKATTAAPESPAEDVNEGLVAAMDELGAALKSGDSAAAARAFESAMQLCRSDYGEE